VKNGTKLSKVKASQRCSIWRKITNRVLKDSEVLHHSDGTTKAIKTTPTRYMKPKVSNTLDPVSFYVQLCVVPSVNYVLRAPIF